ncbi:MAG: putative anion transporting ATPase [Acidimicrobiales bacterium]|nr:putative anion transporting ATPase [Acidimicrobiales bacterium]
MTSSVRQMVGERGIVICCGSGGVGKTTTAAVLALEGARAGRRACVVTIDPAKRLADALGLDRLSNTPSQIDGDWPGELWALMLDTKSTFDSLVAKHAGDEEQAAGILANRFYRNISGALSGTQEYMAMEKLFELHDSGKFDLIVVDTPPTRNALDFLDAPRRLTRFLDNRVFRILMMPTRAYLKAVSVATQAFLRTISKVVGTEVVQDAVAFFQAFEGMEEGFRNRAQKVLELLASPETAFVLVASPRRDAITEAMFFADRLKESHIPVATLVVNRMHPRFGAGSAEADRARSHTLAGAPLGAWYANLADFRSLADGEEAHVAALVERITPAPVVRVPFLPNDVHDLDGLAEVATYVVAG